MIECVILGIALAASMMVLVFKRGLLDALIDALNNFRGGPPAAMHPSPANDAVVLLRRRRNPDSTQSVQSKS
jgi:hypothetical protein